MADIKVVIQLQDTVEDIIEQLGSSTEVNNTSIQNTNGSFGSLSIKNDGINMKSWANVIKDSNGKVVSKVVNGETISKGLLSLADGYVGGADTKLVEQYGYNGYVFGAVPESKQLTVTLEVRGENIDSIIIYGDKNANQFPTKAYRDGDPNDIIYSDDATWAIKFDSPLGSHSITFLEWNRANYNACITYVAELKNKLYLDKSWIKSVESLSQSTGRPKDIYYGVTPSSGSLEIIDVNGEIYDYINDGIIRTSNLPIKISVNGEVCNSHISSDSDYTIDKILSIQNSDILQSWGSFKIKPKVRLVSAGSLFAYFKNMMTSDFGFAEEYVEQMCSEIIKDNMSAKDIMLLIRIPYQYHKSETLLDFVNEVCNVCQFSVICDSNGMPKFVNGNPEINTETILKVPNSIIFGQPSKDVLVKNKINNIKYLEKSFVKSIKDVCNKTFYLKNPDGVVSMNYALPLFDNGAIIGEDSQNYLCFFVECSNADSEFFVTPDSSNDGISLPFKALLKGDSYEQLMETRIPELDETYTKDNYSWMSYGNCCELTRYRGLNTKTFGIKIPLGSVLDILNKIDRITISIFQKCISLSTQEKMFNNNTDFVYDAQDNQFMSLETTYNYTENIYSHNNSQLLNFYEKGVSVANITIGCMDIYDINGNKVKDWDIGQIINVGEIVRIDKDNNGNSLWSYNNGTPMYWKVTGRNFRKNGVPMIDLELQEVRVVV